MSASNSSEFITGIDMTLQANSKWIVKQLSMHWIYVEIVINTLSVSHISRYLVNRRPTMQMPKLKPF